MTDQQTNKIVKALAYGETAQQAAKAEGVTVSDVQRVLVDRSGTRGRTSESTPRAGRSCSR